MTRLKLVKGEAVYDSDADENVTAPDEDDNYGTTVLE